MVPDLGPIPVRDAVKLLARHVAEVVVDSTFSRCIPAMIEGAERDPRVRDFFHRYSADRRQVLIDLIARGVSDGQLPASVDPLRATDALLGTIFYRRLMTERPLAPEEADAVVDGILPTEPP
jgi:hypothetical protein